MADLTPEADDCFRVAGAVAKTVNAVALKCALKGVALEIAALRQVALLNVQIPPGPNADYPPKHECTTPSGVCMSTDGFHIHRESGVIHLSNPDTDESWCGEPSTVIEREGDTRPVCQTCHRGAMKHMRARTFAEPAPAAAAYLTGETTECCTSGRCEVCAGPGYVGKKS